MIVQHLQLNARRDRLWAWGGAQGVLVGETLHSIEFKTISNSQYGHAHLISI